MAKITSVKTSADNNKLFTAQINDDNTREFKEFDISSGINNKTLLENADVTSFDEGMDVVTVNNSGDKFIGVDRRGREVLNLETTNNFSVNSFNIIDRLKIGNQFNSNYPFIRGIYNLDNQFATLQAAIHGGFGHSVQNNSNIQYITSGRRKTGSSFYYRVYRFNRDGGLNDYKEYTIGSYTAGSSSNHIRTTRTSTSKGGVGYDNSVGNLVSGLPYYHVESSFAIDVVLSYNDEGYGLRLMNNNELQLYYQNIYQKSLILNDKPITNFATSYSSSSNSNRISLFYDYNIKNIIMMWSDGVDTYFRLYKNKNMTENNWELEELANFNINGYYGVGRVAGLESGLFVYMPNNSNLIRWIDWSDEFKTYLSN